MVLARGSLSSGVKHRPGLRLLRGLRQFGVSVIHLAMKYVILAFLVVVFVLWLRRPKRVAPDDFQGIFDLIGCIGTADETFTRTGTVQVKGEIWKATSREGIVQKGDHIRVVRLLDGLVLEVERCADEG